MALKAIVMKVGFQSNVFTSRTIRYIVSTAYRTHQRTDYLAQPTQARPISTTSTSRVKEIIETTTGKTTVIEGVNVESDRKGKVLGQRNSTEDELGKPCPLCRLDLDLHHTDVLILSQFVKPNGNLVTQRVSGLCAKQQALVKSLVIQAQKAGLMINLSPDNCNKDPHKRFQWRKCNRYFVPEKNGNKIKRYQ